MGKQRKASKAKAENQYDSHLDIIISILDICGFYDDTTCPRLKLIDSLKALRIQYSRYAWWDESLQMTDKITEELLRLEKLICKVRGMVLQYGAKLEADLVEFIELQKSVVPAPWTHMHESLCSIYRTQRLKEIMALRNITSALDRIYSSPNSSGKSFDQFLEATILCLHRYDLLHRVDFQEVVSVCNQSSPMEAKLSHKQSELTEKKYNSEVGISQVNPCVTSANNVLDAVHNFIRSAGETNKMTSFFTTLLVIGPEGSGKTHLCDEVSLLAKEASCQVIRPDLPIDILGSTVGETEDMIVAMFSAARSAISPTIIVLDGLDHILLETSAKQSASIKNSSSFLRRSTYTFLCVLDAMREYSELGSNILVICTSTRRTDVQYARFDCVHHLEPPNDFERKELLTSFMPILENDISLQDESREQILDGLVEATLGKSYAELVQCCRQAIEDVSTERMCYISARVFFNALKNRLNTSTPFSLQTGVLADSVDMRILSAKDLVTPTECFSFSMNGESARIAWKVLVESIVIPMCRAKELKEVLTQSGTSRSKFVVGGVLLTGESGSGKSRIAWECGRYAASLLPLIKVLDVSCTSLIHKEVGGSERAVQRLFDSARKASPCILLLEGIENIAAVRGNDTTTEGTLDRVLATLLTEMDGVNVDSQQEGGIAVIGMTHNSALIDAAILRPGRLQKTLFMKKDW